MRMCAAIPSTQQLVDAAAGFLRAVGVPHVDLVSHSYGTLVASRLVRCHREVVTTCTMVDPVSVVTLVTRQIIQEGGMLHVVFSHMPCSITGLVVAMLR
jgi:pimeloyl-ACP methyl ester carboxylesterase